MYVCGFGPSSLRAPVLACVSVLCEVGRAANRRRANLDCVDHSQLSWYECHVIEMFNVEAERYQSFIL